MKQRKKMLEIGEERVPNTREGFQNDENRVWGRFQMLGRIFTPV